MSKGSELTYSAGFVRGRLVSVDESTGEMTIVPGLLARFRCTDIIMYNAAEAGIIEIQLRGHMGDQSGFAMVGSVAEMDKIMDRDHLIQRGGSDGSREK